MEAYKQSGSKFRSRTKAPEKTKLQAEQEASPAVAEAVVAENTVLGSYRPRVSLAWALIFLALSLYESYKVFYAVLHSSVEGDSANIQKMLLLLVTYVYIFLVMASGIRKANRMQAVLFGMIGGITRFAWAIALVVIIFSLSGYPKLTVYEQWNVLIVSLFITWLGLLTHRSAKEGSGPGKGEQ